MDAEHSSNDEEKEPTCRICYSTEEEVNNELICPCECKGSIRFVHEVCIKEWARIASVNSDDSMESLKWEICHAVLSKKKQFESLSNIARNLYNNLIIY